MRQHKLEIAIAALSVALLGCGGGQPSETAEAPEVAVTPSGVATLEGKTPPKGDRARNHAVIAEKAETDTRYRELLELADQHDLTIGIRRFKLGRAARTQGTKLGGNYAWKFLKDKHDPVLDQHVGAFVRYWKRFPPAFVKRVGLKGVLFVRTLEWNGMQVYGFELTDGVVFVNLSLGGQLHYPGDEDFTYGLTHELFHLIQNNLIRDKSFVDYDAWDALNPKGVSYHEGGTMGMLGEMKGKQDPWSYLHEEHPEPGFVSRYAMSDHWHDTTETFCALFVTSRYKKAMKWAKKDIHLRAKLDYMKQALRHVHPGFTDAYFDKIHSGGMSR